MRTWRSAHRALAALALAFLPAAAMAFDATWIRTYFGGYGHSVLPTDDGGALLAGTLVGGSVCCPPWIVKLGPDGAAQWQGIYDAPGLGGATHMIGTRDGGYVLAGDGTQFMAVKLDANGAVQWAREYGDGGYTHLRVLEDESGNLLLTGATQLEDPVATNGRAVLLDPQGRVLWQKVYGRPGPVEFLASATVGYDGNYLAVGSAAGDYWILELDRATGEIVWEARYGGAAEDTGLVVARVMRRFYLVVGASDSFAQGGLRDWWALLLTKNGRVSRQFALGGADAEDPHAVLATSDGGFLVGGGTGSFGAGLSDVWLVKFDSRGDVQWQKAYGLPWRTDHAWEARETSTGYLVVGDSYAFPTEYEMLLLSLDRDGNVATADCAEVAGTKALLRPTAAAERIGRAMTYDTRYEPVDLEIAPAFEAWPIDACAPQPPGR